MMIFKRLVLLNVDEDYSRLMASYKVSSYSFENGQNVSQETASKMNFK